MAGEGTDISGQGTVQCFGTHTLDLSADGRIDLKLLNRFDSDLTAAGILTVDMNVGGSWSEPAPQGRLQIADASFAYAGVPSGLTQTNGSLFFTRDQFHIENLSAHAGGGTLDFKGDATVYNRQLNFNLTAAGKDVRLRYPPGVSSTANAELHWAGTRSASTVSGQDHGHQAGGDAEFRFQFVPRAQPPNHLHHSGKFASEQRQAGYSGADFAGATNENRCRSTIRRCGSAAARFSRASSSPGPRRHTGRGSQL